MPGRKVRSNKGKKRGSYRIRKTLHSIELKDNSSGKRKASTRKVRSNKDKKRSTYEPRTGNTLSGKRFRQSGGDEENNHYQDMKRKMKQKIIKESIIECIKQEIPDGELDILAIDAIDYGMNWDTVKRNLCEFDKYHKKLNDSNVLTDFNESKKIICPKINPQN